MPQGKNPLAYVKLFNSPGGECFQPTMEYVSGIYAPMCFEEAIIRVFSKHRDMVCYSFMDYYGAILFIFYTRCSEKSYQMHLHNGQRVYQHRWGCPAQAPSTQQKALHRRKNIPQMVP